MRQKFQAHGIFYSIFRLVKKNEVKLNETLGIKQDLGAMEETTTKIRRSSNLIKGFMVLVIIVQVIESYKNNALDFGAIAGTIAVLSMLRGLLLSPLILVTPFKLCLKSQVSLSPESYKYFLVAFILMIVSAL